MKKQLVYGLMGVLLPLVVRADWEGNYAYWKKSITSGDWSTVANWQKADMRTALGHVPKGTGEWVAFDSVEGEVRVSQDYTAENPACVGLSVQNDADMTIDLGGHTFYAVLNDNTTQEYITYGGSTIRFCGGGTAYLLAEDNTSLGNVSYYRTVGSGVVEVSDGSHVTLKRTLVKGSMCVTGRDSVFDLYPTSLEDTGGGDGFFPDFIADNGGTLNIHPYKSGNRWRFYRDADHHGPTFVAADKGRVLASSGIHLDGGYPHIVAVNGGLVEVHGFGHKDASTDDDGVAHKAWICLTNGTCRVTGTTFKISNGNYPGVIDLCGDDPRLEMTANAAAYFGHASYSKLTVNLKPTLKWSEEVARIEKTNKTGTDSKTYLYNTVKFNVDVSAFVGKTVTKKFPLIDAGYAWGQCDVPTGAKVVKTGDESGNIAVSFAQEGTVLFLVVDAQDLRPATDLVSMAPADYATVALLSDGVKGWKTKTLSARKTATATKETATRTGYQRDYEQCVKPLMLSWSGTGTETCRVVVTRDCDGSVFFAGESDSGSVSLGNLEIGRNYTWTVTCDALGKSVSRHFYTEPDAPRIMNESVSLIGNCRDLGGWTTTDGKVVKQGLVFRSACFDWYGGNNDEGPETAANRVLYSDYWNNVVGIRSEIDLRNAEQLADAQDEYEYTGSLFGPTAKLINSDAICGKSFVSYADIFTADGKKAFCAVFTNFANRAAYPILFHCAQGKDRTGALAYVLNGLLGVPQASLEHDYTFTHYAMDDVSSSAWITTLESAFDSNYPKATYTTVKAQCEAYLKSCGVTDAQIVAVREILLEEPEVKPAASDPDGSATDFVEVEYIENSSDSYVDTGIEIQDKIASSVDHAYTVFPNAGSYMLAANGKINGSSNDRLCLASVNKDKKWRVGLGSASLLTLSDYTTAVLNHRYVAKASVTGTSVKFTLTDKTAGTAAKSVTKTLTASVVTPDEPKTLTLFVLNTATLQYPASAKLYSCQIWTNGTVLARDYVPCYQRSTKLYGLWDKVSETFFPSDSANGFVGPEVKEEEGEGDEDEGVEEPEPKVDLSALLPDEIKCVSIVAPSSQPNSNDVVECVRSLTKAGKTVKVYPGVWKRPDSGADRAREIEAAWQDLETDLILCARGGTGSFDTLKALDFEILKARDVPFMGFSNISTLLNGFVKMGVKRPIAGPLASTLATYPHTEASIRRTHAVLAREDLPTTQLQVRRAPSVAVVGKPLGGHVPSIASMTAEWIPDTTGRIIFLEYNNSYDYTGATNMFRIVKNRGWFDGAAAVVLCEMGISEAGKKEALREHITESVTCPVFSGYTFGHVSGLLALDFGRNLTITPTGELSWGDFSETPVEPPPVEPSEGEGDEEEPHEPQTPVVVSAYKTLNAYLDTDTEGYIITDYVPKLAKTKIEFKVQYLTDPTRAKGGDALCCANGFVGGSVWGNRFHVFSEDWDGLNYENTAWDDVWVGEDEGVYQIISNPDAVVMISAFRQTLAVNDLTFTGAGDIPPEKENQLASGKLVLFAYADSKKNNYVRMTKKRVYSVKVWEIDGGVTNLVMDLVPAVAADGTKTLYDKVAKKCLKPTNGGGFAVGAATETAADAGMVEPTAVFGAANSARRIVYPSAPTLSGDVGAQTVAFGSVSVSVPRHYTAKLSGNSVTLALNDFARPLFGSPEGETKAIVVGEATVTFHVGNRIDGLFYRVVTATALGGEWKPVTGFLPVADFTVDRIKSDSAAFYKIEVSDAN